MNRLIKLATLLLCPVVSAMASTASCDWVNVNHDHKNTRSSPCTTVTFDDLVAGLVVQQWIAPGGAVQAAPIVSDGVVYYGDSNGNLFARDITNGNLLYSYVFPSGENPQGPQTLCNGVLYATTVSPNALPAGGLRLYAFDLTLVPIPGFNGGLPVDVDPGNTGLDGNILSGPVVVDNIVVVGTTNATIQEVSVIFPTYRGGFQAFNATTGEFLWRTPVNSATSGYGTCGGSFSTPGVDRSLQLMFVGTSNATSPPAGPYTDALLAINYTNGDIVWSQQYTEDDVYGVQYGCGHDWDLGASPNLFTIHHDGEEVDVVGANSKEGIYRVFKRSNGEPIWHKQITPANSIPSIDGAPGGAYNNGIIYAAANIDTSGIASNSFNIVAGIAESLGSTDPLYEVQLPNFLTKDVCYITALDAHHGHVLWSNSRVSATEGSVTEANGVIYTVNFAGEFRGINAETGEDILIGTSPSNIPMGAPVTVVGNQFFLGFDIGAPGGLIVFYKP